MNKLEFVFHKVDDSCKHEVANPEYEIVLTTRYKHTHEAQNTLKQIQQAIEKEEKYDNTKLLVDSDYKLKLVELQSQNKSLSEENARLKEEENQRCYFCNHRRESHPSWQSNACVHRISSVSSGATSTKDCKCPCSIYGNRETGLPEYYPIRDGIIDKQDEKTMLKFKNLDRKSILDRHETQKDEIQNLKAQLEETKEEQDAFLRFNGCDSFLQLQNKIHDSFSKEEKLQKQLEQANKVIQLIKDFSKFEQLCLDCEYSTVSGVDVEKLQQSILAKYEEKS